MEGEGMTEVGRANGAGPVRDHLAFSNEAWREFNNTDRRDGGGWKWSDKLKTRGGEAVPRWTLNSDVVLERYGTRFTKVSEPHEVDGDAGLVRHCYANTWAWADDRKDYEGERGWRYYEGKAISENLPLPLSHAWAVNVETGEVVDMTWCEDNDLPVGTDYVGIEIPKSVVDWLITEHETCGVLPNWWLLSDKMRKRVLRHNARKVKAR